VSIEHGEKILKIRLNNQIQRNSRFLGYPLRGAKGTLSFTPVKRIVVSFRTQWLQELNIDHVFAPNTQIEWDLSKGSPDKVWLKDIFTMDLGEHTQSENALELAYHIEFYCDEENNIPTVKTTNKKHVMPIYRKNRYQRVQKFKKNNENALTLVIALASLLSSVYLFLSAPPRIPSFPLELEGISQWILPMIIVLAIFGILGTILTLFLFKETKKRDRDPTIQP